MADRFFDLSPQDRRDAIETASQASRRPSVLLEKDVWVVWTIDVLFRSPDGEDLLFKGGTSLSKAYGAIRRFSEDVDITFDIRALAPDLVDKNGDGLPPNRSQLKKWRDVIDERLPAWVADVVLARIDGAIRAERLPARAIADGDRIRIEYDALATGEEYVQRSVLLEFGARSIITPFERKPITCDAARYLTGVTFPDAEPQVMRIERTFWEKATAAHVFCIKEQTRADRFARHWHDIARLDEGGHANRAIADRETAECVAAHKAAFFRETGPDGGAIDYDAAIRGRLRLVPRGEAHARLATDYDAMVNAGILEDNSESFDELMDRCRDVERKANEAGRAG